MGVQRLRVLNVLSPEYYEDAHIKGSINVPLSELKDFAQHTEKNTPLVVYCANYECQASINAWHILHELGFENILAYEGGMNEWYHAELSTNGSCDQDYLKTKIAQNGEQDKIAIIIDMLDLKTLMEKEGLL